MKINTLTDKEISELVEIHSTTLEDGLLSKLGNDFLVKFYNFLCESSDENIFVIKDNNNRIIGACILSFSPTTLMKRVFKKLWFSLILNSMTNFLTNDLFRKYTIGILINKSNFISKSPEITYIFSHKSHQNMGIGKKLIGHIEDEFSAIGVSKYYVKTIDNKSNQAIQFYKKNNFKIQFRFKYMSNTYLYLVKYLNV